MNSKSMLSLEVTSVAVKPQGPSEIRSEEGRSCLFPREGEGKDVFISKKKHLFFFLVDIHYHWQ